MLRRTFLQALGAAAIVPASAYGQTPPGATVLYDGKVVTLDRVRPDAKNPAALWVQKRDLPRINEFELKPEGMCRADLCIPVTRDLSNGDYFNLTAFAGKVSQSFVTDTPARAWSFGEMPVLRGAFVESRVAPDFSVPDRKGKNVTLSDFRGKKVLVVTWASW
jgi:hypothetical protein